MTYVLLLMIWMGDSGAVTSAEYQGKEACVAAGEAAVRDFKLPMSIVRYSCSVKNSGLLEK